MRRAEPSASRRVSRVWCQTYALWAVWTLETLNYVVHEACRPEPWAAASRAAGYTLWAVQLACFVQVQLTDPGTAPADWEALARAGTEQASVCKRSGRLVPPRGRYVRRTGTVVLGLDHYCHWLGTPIGHFNRKAFVLFVAYSALFCWMGTAFSLYEATRALPLRIGFTPFSAAVNVPHGVGVRAAPAAAYTLLCDASGWLWELLSRSSAAGCAVYAVAVLATCALNPLAATALSCGALNQLLLAMYNRTTLAPYDRTYDVGVAANLTQVRGGGRGWVGAAGRGKVSFERRV